MVWSKDTTDIYKKYKQGNAVQFRKFLYILTYAELQPLIQDKITWICIYIGSEYNDEDYDTVVNSIRIKNDHNVEIDLLCLSMWHVQIIFMRLANEIRIFGLANRWLRLEDLIKEDTYG